MAQHVITEHKKLPAAPIAEPELVMILKSGIEHTRTPGRGLFSAKEDLSGVQSILDGHQASLSLLFGPSEERLRNPPTVTMSKRVPGRAQQTDTHDLSTFYRVHGKADSLKSIAAELCSHPQVEAAYVKPGGSPPVIIVQRPPTVKPSDMAPSSTPNFVNHQGYLNPAPEGIDSIHYANYLVGGQGEGIRIVDCEWGWRFTHEDLLECEGGVIAGTATTLDDYVNHGTAVEGILGGDVNPYGVTGICPRPTFYGSSLWDQSTSTAIKAAADRLGPRDFILLEVHRSGPKSTGSGQEGYIAIEWWPDDFAAIKYATDKGIIVVEAAGNGSQNLDDPVYDSSL